MIVKIVALREVQNSPLPLPKFVPPKLLSPIEILQFRWFVQILTLGKILVYQFN